MNWRWIVPAGAFFLLIEVLTGIGAYGSKSWNLAHTEVITGWPAVREMCLIFVPAFFAVNLLGVGLVVLAIRWAARGGR